MGARMSLTQDVLETIGVDGVEKDRLREKVGNITQVELDRVVNELSRAGKLRQVGTYYFRTGSTPASIVVDGNVTVGGEVSAPEMRTCRRCGSEKELNKANFSRNGHGFMRICKVCYGAAISAGSKGRGRPAVEITGKDGAPILMVRAQVPESSVPIYKLTDPLVDRVKADQQADRNRVTLLEVDVANLRSRIAEREQFLALYERFAGEGI